MNNTPEKSRWNCPVELQEISLKETRVYIKEKFHIDVTEARIRRWICSGLVSYSGNRIFLRAKRRACWYTCQAWIDSYIERLGA